MPADDHLGEAWRAEWKNWLAANLPAALTALEFEVREAHEEGDRPERLVVVGFQRVQRVPSMAFTGRVFGGIGIRAPHDDFTVEQHRGHAAELWGLLQTVTTKPGPFTTVYLHDVRWEDRETDTDDGDRVSAWPISTMCSRCEEQLGIGEMAVGSTLKVG